MSRSTTETSVDGDLPTPVEGFTVGTRVVYPSHGVAKIVRRERRTIGDDERVYLVLEVPDRVTGSADGGMVLSVPEDGATALGVRPAISASEADEVLELLRDHNVHVPSNWSRRFKNHQEKLKTGDVYQCAEVVRNLAVRSHEHPMSAGERTMYTKARYILTSELAVSWGVDDATAAAKVDEALAP